MFKASSLSDQTQELIEKLLTHEPKARQPFMAWWGQLNTELAALAHPEVNYGEARAIYTSFIRLEPSQAVAVVRARDWLG